MGECQRQPPLPRLAKTSAGVCLCPAAHDESPVPHRQRLRGGPGPLRLMGLPYGSTSPTCSAPFDKGLGRRFLRSLSSERRLPAVMRNRLQTCRENATKPFCGTFLEAPCLGCRFGPKLHHSTNKCRDRL